MHRGVRHALTVERSEPFLNKKKDVKLCSKMPFERREILFSKGFFDFTDIRKL